MAIETVKYFTSTKFLWISLLLLTTDAFAQVTQTTRYELLLSGGQSSYEVTPIGNAGLLLSRESQEAQQSFLEIIKLDTAQQEIWRGSILLTPSFVVSHKRFFESNLYALLKGKSYFDFQLLQLEQATGKYTLYNLRNYIPFTPTEFEVNNNGAVIGGYYNRVPIVVFFEFATQQLKILPGLFSEVGELAQIKIYADHTFDVLLCARYFNREKTIWIKSYSPKGDFISQLVMPTEGNRSLLFGRILKADDDTKVVAGVYGNRNSEYSKGIFLASIDPFGSKELKYYNYADLENFFDYMRVKKEKRVKSRIERRKIKGKANRFNYRILVHELIPFQNQFVLLGEAFYPKYKSADRVGSSGYGGFFSNPHRNYVNSYDRIFDGFRYTHATILGFNNTGQLLWDNSFEINDVKTFEKEQFVKLKTSSDRITLLYLFENQLKSKIIKGGEVVTGKAIERIKTFDHSTTRTVDTSIINKLDYWYDDYLIASGVQEVVNENAIGDHPNKRVFFLTKVRCR